MNTPDDHVPALRYDERPADRTPIHTSALPDTPTRDRNIVATAWIEAPPEVLTLGDDLPNRPEAEYKRRIGRWLLWRAGKTPVGSRVARVVIATSSALRMRVNHGSVPVSAIATSAPQPLSRNTFVMR